MFALRTELITIEVNHYVGRQTESNQLTVTADEAEQIRFYLIELYNAQQRNDRTAIDTFEALLYEKGLFGANHPRFTSDLKGIALLEKAGYSSAISSMADENISNSMCFFNAVGEGLMLWWIGQAFVQGLIDAINNVSNPTGAVILYIILLPFIVLTLLLTDLIPFRIFSPPGVITLKNGTIAARGANGAQKVTVGEDAYGVNLSGFTGITINIPPINNRKAFLFVSGFSLKAEGKWV